MVQTDQVSESGQQRPSHPTGWSDLPDLLAFLDAMGLIALLVVDESGLARLLLTFGFTFFVPGRAIVDNCSFLAWWSEAAMSLVLSLAVVGLLNSGLMGSRLAPAGAVSNRGLAERGRSRCWCCASTRPVERDRSPVAQIFFVS